MLDIGVVEVIDKHTVALADLEAMETDRLEQAAALAAFRRLSRPRRIARRGCKRKREGPLGKEPAGDGGSSSESSCAFSDLGAGGSGEEGAAGAAGGSGGPACVREAVPGDAVPDGAGEAHAAARPRVGRGERGFQWGPFVISDIASRGEELIGVGAKCGRHFDDGSDLACKKQVTFGKSGIGREEMIRRLKRWLVAGLDDAEWDAESHRVKHVGMGGVYLRDFAEGLSGEQLNDIIRRFDG